MLPLLLLCIAAGASAANVDCCTGLSKNPLPIAAVDCAPSSSNDWAMVFCFPVQSCMSIKCSNSMRPSEKPTYSQFCATQDKVNETIRLNAASGINCVIAAAASRTAPTFAMALVVSLAVIFAM